ncbi:MAG: DUF4065 domain-containing protein [Bacteroidetes bacterium]|nr:DUF4065 domain-containing protein [Bacteroidota bacterium]
MVKISEISDYIIFKLKSEGALDLSTLKHQKLLYYAQAWHLAFFEGEKLFEGEFQAWIHGPVNREIYDLYKEKKYLYSEMMVEDITNLAAVSLLAPQYQNHLNTILDVYAPFTATQLEYMTHNELPWIEARKGYSPYARCEQIINEKTMQSYYSARLK